MPLRKHLKRAQQKLLTDSGPVEVHVEGSDQVLQERPDQPEVDATDAPGSVHQDDDVRLGFTLTREGLF